MSGAGFWSSGPQSSWRSPASLRSPFLIESVFLFCRTWRKKHIICDKNAISMRKHQKQITKTQNKTDKNFSKHPVFVGLDPVFDRLTPTKTSVFVPLGDCFVGLERIKKALERCPGQFLCRVFIRSRVQAIVGLRLSRTKFCHL